MGRRSFSIGLLVLVVASLVGFSACKKALTVEPEPATPSYSRSGVAPVTLYAGNETRTALEGDESIRWNQGDAIVLLREARASDNVKCLMPADIRDMAVGTTKSIILVNPSSSGYFLGYDGKEAVKNTSNLSNLQNGTAADNLEAITGYAAGFQNDPNFIFTVERTETGWLIYHQGSGIGLTTTLKDKYNNDEKYYYCVWSNDVNPVDIQEITGESNWSSSLVPNRPEQIWVENGDRYFRSGGTSQPLTWSTNGNSGWTNWLFYEVPGRNKYQFTADESGVSVSFTNKTGFKAGEDTWYAVYPESVLPTNKDGKLQVTLPSFQSYVPGSFDEGAYVSAGVLQGDHISFRGLFGVLKLSMKGTQRVLSITVTDNAGASLWGDASVGLSALAEGDCSARVTGGSSSLTLNCGSGVVLSMDTATDFYLVVPVGSFAEGFQVKVITSEGSFMKTTSKDNKIVRADVKSMPEFTLNSSGMDVTEVNIENEVVHAYMSYGAYNYFGEESYFVTKEDVKALATSCRWNNDQPVGWKVTWSGSDPVSISVTQDGKDWYTKSGLEWNEYTITNLTPGSKYTYSITRNGEILSEGAFKAVGQVRMVSIPDSWNYRDLGGWTGLNGATVQYGKLYRGGSLNGQFNGSEQDHQNADFANFTFSSQSEIDQLGIKAELDLRGNPKTASGQWGYEQYAHSLALLQTQLKDADYIQIMSDWGLYYPFKRSSMIQDVAWIIYELKQGKPVAFHCKSGADRTGAVALLIEGLLGVTEGDAARDYELTSLSPETDQRYAKNASFTFFKSNGLFSVEKETFQEKCYYYLNEYFDDVHINASDLNWFIGEMLGMDGYKPAFSTKEYNDNPLEKVFSMTEGSASINNPGR